MRVLNNKIRTKISFYNGLGLWKVLYSEQRFFAWNNGGDEYELGVYF